MNRITSYKDFKAAFDQMDEESLMRSDRPGSALYELSRFSRENPVMYQKFRQRMHDEDLFAHNERVQKSEYW